MIDLNDERIMSGPEACERWGYKDSSIIRQRVSRFPEGTIRKFGTTLVVTYDGMLAVFGEPRKKQLDAPVKKVLKRKKKTDA